ncbi:MAG TPA: hypothetical protein DCS63_07635 [Elusimicrobia bacterium]|nr:hypothetical protein [Elusimicrobiota bacterium]
MIRFLAVACLFWTVPSGLYAAGGHTGEAGKIVAKVTFQNPAGTTFTDAAGIRYTINSWTFASEPKVYPAQYWGKFPLYFVGTAMKFTVSLTNTAAAGEKRFKVRVQALNNVLGTDGTAGREIAPPQEWTVSDLKPGETRNLEAAIFIAPDPNLPSGLDITKIRISHLNEGANDDAALIKEEIAVWCPPPDKK